MDKNLLGTGSVLPLACPPPCVGSTGGITVSDLSIGSHSIIARFAGNSTYNPATSNIVVQVVGGTIPTLRPVGLAAFALLLAAAGIAAVRLVGRG